MLTPLDIHNREFKKVLRGYDVDEVDEFLDEVIRDFEGLYKENLDLKDSIQKLEDNIKHYKELEKTLQNTLVLAQQTADEARQNAAKEAELTIWEAQKKAEKIINETQSEVLERTRKLEEMKGLEKHLYVKMKSFLKSQLDYMDNYDLEKEELDQDNCFEVRDVK